ncbi:MAG TPA: hypothetical protein VIU62_16730 [Chloroflexota bacterium]
MDIAETIKALKVLMAFGLSNAPKISAEPKVAAAEYSTLATAYQYAWSDLPASLIDAAVKDWVRGDNAFWPRAGQLRAIALRSALGIPSAELAYEEVRLAFGGRTLPWSTDVLERTVAAMGWRTLCDWPIDNLGTCRAQFRDTYNSVIEQVLQSDDVPALLAGAAHRQAALERAKRPDLVPGYFASLPEHVPDGYDTMGKDAPATRWTAERFAEINPTRALPLPPGDPVAMLRRITSAPEWSDMPADVRQQQLQRFLAKHPEYADLPELAGITPDAVAKPALEHLAVDVAGFKRANLRMVPDRQEAR